LIILNLIFYGVYNLIDPLYTDIMSPKMREIILLFNFCYFFALYFVPMRLHMAVVFLDRIVQRSVYFVTVFIFLFAICLLFLNVGDKLATFITLYYLSSLLIFSLWRVLVRIMVKSYRRKGYNVKNIIIVGAGKNGMELYQVIKTDLSYGKISLSSAPAKTAWNCIRSSRPTCRTGFTYTVFLTTTPS